MTDFFFTTFAGKAPFDHFDLQAVFAAYELLGIDLSAATQSEIRKYCSVDISEFASDTPFRYSSAASVAQMVTTGLLLGYPVQSTASLISDIYA